jgi:hypothetical protein
MITFASELDQSRATGGVTGVHGNITDGGFG